MFRTAIACRAAGVFHGPMVVSMRPIRGSDVAKAVTASARFPGAHGAPVHIGDPAAIGIEDLTRPDYGDVQHFEAIQHNTIRAAQITHLARQLGALGHFAHRHLLEVTTQIGEDIAAACFIRRALCEFLAAATGGQQADADFN